MDNLRKVLPIRSYGLQHPLVVAFNIHLSHYNAYGTRHYDRLQKALTDPAGANLEKDRVYLLPNITNFDTSIEIRGQSMAASLERLLGKIRAESCHLVAHSFTGIDARAAISMFEAHKLVSSLTTVCTPHLGMALIDRAYGEPWHGNLENLERIFDVLGITAEGAKEFSSVNLGAFNQVCDNHADVSYYSIGAKKSGRTMNAVLRDGHNLIVNDNIALQCDGLVQDVEARWGEYLITFENDHLEVMGLEPGHNPANVFNLVADNCRLSEIRNDPENKIEYGVDHLNF